MRKYLLIAVLLFFPLLAFGQTITTPFFGGTGTGVIPTKGQVLVGQTNGTYLPQPTSTLNISSGSNNANDWRFTFSNSSAITPTTSVGIFINASSTINANFRVSGNSTTTGHIEAGQYLIGNQSMLRWDNPLGSLYLGPDSGIGNTQTDVVTVGRQAGLLSTGGGLTAIGTYAGQQTTGAGLYQTFVGYQAGIADSSGAQSTIVGGFAGNSNSGANLTAMGYLAAGGNNAIDVTAFGTYAGQNNTGDFLTVVGEAAAANNSGDFVTVLGEGAAGSNTGNYITALGEQTAVGNTFNEGIALGFQATLKANHQFVVGGSSGIGYITDAYFGSGVSSTAPFDFTIHASGGDNSGTVDGADLRVVGGYATNGGLDGNVILANDGLQNIGHVGIATSTPKSLSKLEIVGDNGNQLSLIDSSALIDNTSNNGLNFSVSNGLVVWRGEDSQGNVGGSARFALDLGSNRGGIGTTTLRYIFTTTASSSVTNVLGYSGAANTIINVAPTDDNFASLILATNDVTGSTTEAVKLSGKFTDHTAGSVDGAFDVSGFVNGTLTQFSYLDGTGLTLPSLAGSGTKCVHSVDGLLSLAASDCGSGGGGSSEWQYTFDGNLTPTSSSAGIYVNASSTFNGNGAKVRLGTTGNPVGSLSVIGVSSVAATTTGQTAIGVYGQADGGSMNNFGGLFFSNNSTSSVNIAIGASAQSGIQNFSFFGNAGTLYNNGVVTIGTTTPNAAEKLEVSGTGDSLAQLTIIDSNATSDTVTTNGVAFKVNNGDLFIRGSNSQGSVNDRYCLRMAARQLVFGTTTDTGACPNRVGFWNYNNSAVTNWLTGAGNAGNEVTNTSHATGTFSHFTASTEDINGTLIRDGRMVFTHDNHNPGQVASTWHLAVAKNSSLFEILTASSTSFMIHGNTTTTGTFAQSFGGTWGDIASTTGRYMSVENLSLGGGLEHFAAIQFHSPGSPFGQNNLGAILGQLVIAEDYGEPNQNPGLIFVDPVTTNSVNFTFATTSNIFSFSGQNSSFLFDRVPAFITPTSTQSTLARIGGTLHTDTVAVGNVGAGVDDLQTYSLQANTLTQDGDSLEWKVAYTTSAGATVPTFSCLLGSTTIVSTTNAGANSDGEITMTIIRAGSSSEKVMVQSDKLSLFGSINYITATEDLHTPLTMKCTGSDGLGATNAIVEQANLIQYNPTN